MPQTRLFSRVMLQAPWLFSRLINWILFIFLVDALIPRWCRKILFILSGGASSPVHLPGWCPKPCIFPRLMSRTPFFSGLMPRTPVYFLGPCHKSFLFSRVVPQSIPLLFPRVMRQTPSISQVMPQTTLISWVVPWTPFISSGSVLNPHLFSRVMPQTQYIFSGGAPSPLFSPVMLRTPVFSRVRCRPTVPRLVFYPDQWKSGLGCHITRWANYRRHSIVISIGVRISYLVYNMCLYLSRWWVRQPTLPSVR